MTPPFAEKQCKMIDMSINMNTNINIATDTADKIMTLNNWSLSLGG